MKTVGIPLVLTFRLDPSSQERFDAWRSRYFLGDRNRIKAHLSIFHQLPGQELDSIEMLLAEYAARKRIFPVEFNRLMTRLGFVGVGSESEGLREAQAELSSLLEAFLRAQDRRVYRPHVTLANLGSPREAARCHAEVEAEFAPWKGQIEGLDLYHYRNGPWEFARYFPFAAPAQLQN